MVTTAVLLGTVHSVVAAGGRCLDQGFSGSGCVKLGFLRNPGSVQGLSPAGGGAGGKGGVVRLMGRFRGLRQKGQELELESVTGGMHMRDAAQKEEEFPEHLLIMVNGIVGSADDWKYAAEQFAKKFADKVIVHRSQCNYSTLTFDGVDLMGERLAEEVLSVASHRPGVKKISFVAHSLGGLVARYAIGRLFETDPFPGSSNVTWNSLAMGGNLQGRVAGLEPINFITVATPHLGSRGHKQLPFLLGLSFLERSASQTAHLLVGRTGNHLFLTDNDEGKHPLLLRMVDDCGGLKFRSALCSFRRRVAYANTDFDHMVGWRTSSIRRQHELPNSNLLVSHKRYPHIVYEDRGDNATIHKEASSGVSVQTVDLEEEMIRGLTQVPWERIDVSFRESTQRYIAHSTIQVKTYWMNSDGADVISHMIDNFLI